MPGHYVCRSCRSRRLTFACIAAGAAFAELFASASSAQEWSSNSWQFSVTPYVWLPNINGALKFAPPSGGTGDANATVGPNDYLSNLELALMVAGEARKGNYALFTDLIYLDFKNDRSSVTSVSGPGGVVEIPVDTGGTKSSFTGLVWTMGGSYTVLRRPAATLDLLAGFRYVGVRASLDWNFSTPISLLPGSSGSISQTVDLWDGIIGAKGRLNFGDTKWFAPYYIDVGTGSTKFTWQGLIGVGYAFRWGDVLLAYRSLSIEQGDDKLIQHLRFSGPALGATFHF